MSSSISNSSDEEADTPKPKVRKLESNPFLSEPSTVEKNETSLRKQTKPHDVMISDNSDSVSHVKKCIVITISSDEETGTPQPSVRKQTRNSSQSVSSNFEKQKTKVICSSRKQTRKPNVNFLSSSDSKSSNKNQVTKPNHRNVNVNNKNKQGKQRTRSEYTLDEDNKIIEYVKANPRCHKNLMCNEFWQKMETTGILPDRSWQSVRERWIKHLYPKIDVDKLCGSAQTRSNQFSTTSAPRLGKNGCRPPQFKKKSLTSTPLIKEPEQHQAYPEKKAHVLPLPTAFKPNSDERNADSAEPKKTKMFKLYTKFKDPSSPKPSEQFPTPISIKRSGRSILDVPMRNHGVNLARKKEKLQKMNRKNTSRMEATKIQSDKDSSVDESQDDNCQTSKSLASASLGNKGVHESVCSLRFKCTQSPDQEKQHQNSMRKECTIENELISTSNVDEDMQETELCKSPDEGKEETDRGAGKMNAFQELNNSTEYSQFSYHLVSSAELYDLPVSNQINCENDSVSLSPRSPCNAITPEEVAFETDELSDGSSCKDLTEYAVRRRLMSISEEERIPVTPERIDFAANYEQEHHQRYENLSESPERLAFDAVPEVDQECHSSGNESDDGLFWRGPVHRLTKRRKLLKMAFFNKMDELQEQSKDEGESELLDSSCQNGLNMLGKLQETSEEGDESELLDSLGSMSPQVGSQSPQSSVPSPLCDSANKSAVINVLSPKIAYPLSTVSPQYGTCYSSQTSEFMPPLCSSANESAVLNVPLSPSANPLSIMSPRAGSCSLSQTSSSFCVFGNESAVISVKMQPSKSVVCNVDIDDSVCDNSLTQRNANDTLSENLMCVNELAESSGTRNSADGGSGISQQNSSLVGTGEMLPASAAARTVSDLSVSHSCLEDGLANHQQEEKELEEREIMVQARELKIKNASTSPINWSVEQKSLVSEIADRNGLLKHSGRLPAKSKTKRNCTSETTRKSAYVTSEEESLYPASPVPGDFQCSYVESPAPAKYSVKANDTWL